VKAEVSDIRGAFFAWLSLVAVGFVIYLAMH
jgi:hypothetical protein